MKNDVIKLLEQLETFIKKQIRAAVIYRNIPINQF